MRHLISCALAGAFLSACGSSDDASPSDRAGTTGGAAGAGAGGDASVSPLDGASSPDGGFADAPGPVPCSQPLCEPTPPSTLIAPKSTTVAFAVTTDVATRCAWSTTKGTAFAQMTPFDQGQGTIFHQTTFSGLSSDPATVNHVYVRCDAGDAYTLDLRYRAIADAKPSFPRKGNLWGSWNVVKKGIAYASHIDLYLGAGFSETEIVELRAANPNILVLDSINTVERSQDEIDVTPIPDSYWLKDTAGKKIEVWPGAWRLNLTKPEVAQMQAQYAYQKMLDANLSFDGCFFDNFFTSQSWLTKDVWGNPVAIDADGDGKADDPVVLDAAWKAGVYAELREFRRLMPFALTSGHLPRPPTDDLGAIFNGDSIGFMEPETREATTSFGELWDTYQGWWQVGQKPVITMIEAAPPTELSYGYDYSPLDKIPAPTLEFARTFYPNVRFGLGVTLMNDGYFAYEFGDTDHGQDWWYDELDQDLGQACGPATRVPIGTVSPVDLVTNGDFENAAQAPWSLWADTTAAATLALDTQEHAAGAQSARVSVTKSDGTDWHVGLSESNLSISAGTIYDLELSLKASAPSAMSLGLQKGGGDWHSYGLYRQLDVPTSWKKYVISFEALETATDARLTLSLGAQATTIWIDAVSIREHPADVFQRAFEKGLAVLNGTRKGQTVDVGAGLTRFTGAQAPRYQYIVDDADLGFSPTTTWQDKTYESAKWAATGPFFHDWGAGLKESSDAAASAVFSLSIPADDTYSIDAWWPAAPAATGWSKQVTFDVLAGTQIVATKTLDQSSTGDQWHRIAEVPLKSADAPVVRITNAGTGAVVADAILVQSSARYNDGSAASSVTLGAMDAIVLKRAATGCP
jgi:hypothetical protein